MNIRWHRFNRIFLLRALSLVPMSHIISGNYARRIYATGISMSEVWHSELLGSAILRGLRFTPVYDMPSLWYLDALDFRVLH
jgi:hypothetical protein